MKSIIKKQNSGLPEIIIEHPKDFIAPNGFVEMQHYTDEEQAKGVTRKIILDGIQIAYKELKITQPQYIEVEHDFPFLKMQFEMEGYSDFTSKIKGVPNVLIKGGCHQFLFLPEVKGSLYYPQSRKSLDINLSMPFINRVFKPELIELQQLGTAIIKHEAHLLFDKCVTITSAMLICINDIVNCPMQDHLKKAYLEAKVIELLCLQLNQLHNDAYTKSSINKSDIDKLYFAKQLIEKNIVKPYTINQLAHEVFLNEFKLKRGFKQLFGTTIFGYLTHLRMDYARKMIINDGFTVSEAAYMVGYKHSQHFVNAFKKQFGFTPGKLKCANG